MKTVEEAKELLRNHGYYVDNLWQNDDVDWCFDKLGVRPPEDVDSSTKQAILDDTLSNAHTMETIWEVMGQIIQENYYPELFESEDP